MDPLSTAYEYSTAQSECMQKQLHRAMASLLKNRFSKKSEQRKVIVREQKEFEQFMDTLCTVRLLAFQYDLGHMVHEFFRFPRINYSRCTPSVSGERIVYLTAIENTSPDVFSKRVREGGKEGKHVEAQIEWALGLIEEALRQMRTGEIVEDPGFNSFDGDATDPPPRHLKKSDLLQLRSDLRKLKSSANHLSESICARWSDLRISLEPHCSTHLRAYLLSLGHFYTFFKDIN